MNHILWGSSVVIQFCILYSFFWVSDYHYVTREVMQRGIDNGDFIENAEFSGNMYGTSKAAVQDVQAKNLICILDIDMQGVRNIKTTDLNPIYISIQPPSMEILVCTQGSVNWYTVHCLEVCVFPSDMTWVWRLVFIVPYRPGHTGFGCSLVLTSSCLYHHRKNV